MAKAAYKQEEESLHQQISLITKEETSDVLHLEHGFVLSGLFFGH
jgi:hypothetical protein